MPHSVQRPATSASPSLPSADAARVSASNQTVDTFLGGHRPTWMPNAQHVRPIQTENYHRTKPREPASRAPQIQSHFQVAPQPLITPIVASGTSEESVLPSPALTNEPSPADTTRNTSPNVSAGTIPTAQQDHRPTEGAPASSRTDSPREARAHTLSSFAVAALERSRVAPSSAAVPSPAPTPSALRQAAPRNGPAASFREIQPRPSNQGAGLPAGRTVSSTHFDARLPAEAEAHRTKRVRGSAVNEAPRTPTSAGQYRTEMDQWTQRIDARIAQFGGLLGFSNELDKLRYQYLKSACDISDTFYVVLHQFLCHWTIQRDAVTRNLAQIPEDVVNKAMNLLQNIVRLNSDLTMEHLSWFATFPLPVLEQAGPIRHEIARYLFAFASQWEELQREFASRQVPLTACELVIVLKCKSKTLNGVLFTVSRRSMGIDDPDALALNRLFSEDQQMEDMFAIQTGMTDDEMMEIRSDFGRQYYVLVDQLRRTGRIGEFRQILRPQNVAVHAAYAALPPTQDMQAASARTFQQGQGPRHGISQPMAALPSPGGYSGPHSSAASPYNGQLERPQLVSPAYMLTSNGPQNSPPSLPFAPLNSGHISPAGPGAPGFFPGMTWNPAYQQQNPSFNHVGGVVAGNQPVAPAAHQIPAPQHPTGLGISQPRRGRRVAPIADQRTALRPAAQPSPASASQQVARGSQHVPAQAIAVPPRENHNGAHLPQARSPKRQPLGSVIPSSPHYQYVTAFAVGPRRLLPGNGLERVEFALSKDDLDKISTSAKDEITGLPVNHYFDGSHRYRVRLCTKSQREVAVKEGDWVVSPSFWPSEFYFSINGKPIVLGRKNNFRYDLPADISRYVIEGTNTLKISFPDRGQNVDKNKTYFIAVEDVVTHRYETVRSLVLSCGHHPAAETAEEISRRLSGEGSEEISVENKMLTIATTDPFTSVMFDIPVRGRDCRHLECFDLDVWLSTREGKPSNIKSQEPSLVDKWSCPICGLDARPSKLRIDDFMSSVRKELLANDMKGIRSIQVSADGTWFPVAEADDSDDEDERPNTASTAAQGSKGSFPVVVEILDD